MRNVKDDGWFSDGGDKHGLYSLRGSHDESIRYPEWNEGMDMGDVELYAGMKLTTRQNYEDILKIGL